MLAPTPVLLIMDTQKYYPELHVWRGTRIDTGLTTAEQMARTFLTTDSDLEGSCVIILMSDGRDHEDSTDTYDATVSTNVATRIKAIPDVSLCATYFSTYGVADPEAEQILMSIASPSYYIRTHSSQDLRRFFFESYVRS